MTKYAIKSALALIVGVLFFLIPILHCAGVDAASDLMTTTGRCMAALILGGLMFGTPLLGVAIVILLSRK